MKLRDLLDSTTCTSIFLVFFCSKKTVTTGVHSESTISAKAEMSTVSDPGFESVFLD